jgi:hypothetical protein
MRYFSTMKYLINLILLCFFFNIASGQVFNLFDGHKILTKPMSLSEAKKLLSKKFQFAEEGEMSDAGNIAYSFEAKANHEFVLNILYSTVLGTISYLQFYDDAKQTTYYKKQIMELGFAFIDKKYSENGRIQMYGYRKGDLQYVIELGSKAGMCKIHMSNKSN